MLDRVTVFRDRHDAGARLADALQDLAHRPDVVVLALPRGGVPVGHEIATRLGVPLDVLVVRKLGVPGHSELAMGAIASGGIQVVDSALASRLRIPREAFEAVVRAEREELARREQLFRGDRPPLDVRGKTVVLVDDGLATGSTMRAAILALRSHAPTAIVVAVPVAAPQSCESLGADRVVCLVKPEDFHAVGLWYDDFEQTTDEQVRELLSSATTSMRSP